VTEYNAVARVYVWTRRRRASRPRPAAASSGSAQHISAPPARSPRDDDERVVLLYIVLLKLKLYIIELISRLEDEERARECGMCVHRRARVATHASPAAACVVASPEQRPSTTTPVTLTLLLELFVILTEERGPLIFIY